MTPLSRCTSFLRAHVFPFECVYNAKGEVIAENDPDDPGGVTKYGIDQRSHPRTNIRALTEPEAIRIYLLEWMDAPCDELPCPLGELLFDVQVNGGPGAKWLQMALGVSADGFIGPVTLAAAKQRNDRGSKKEMANTINRVCDERNSRYRQLAQKPRFAKFLNGWLRRSEALRALCLSSRFQSKIVEGGGK